MRGKRQNKQLVFIAFILLLEAFYFRNIIFSDGLLGNAGDSKFINLILEHWYNSFLGNNTLMDFNMFYPTKGVLAYSDLLLGFVPLYILFRIVSLNMYLACKWTMIIVHVFGSLTCYYFLNKKLKINPYYAVCGVIIFAYANMGNLSGHLQMYAIFFVPTFAIFTWNYFENLEGNSWNRIKYALATILCGALIFYTAGYVGYYLAIFCLVILVYTSLACLYKQKEKVEKVCSYISSHKWEFLGLSFFCCLIFIPFLMIYLPISEQFGRKSWSDIAIYLPRLYDYINIESSNLLLGDLASIPFPPHNTAELQLGYSPIIIILFIVAMAFLFHKCIKENHSASIEHYILAIGCSVIIISILMLKTQKNISLWYLIYRFIPGVGSMRAVYRFNHFLTFPVAIVLTYYANSNWRSKRPIILCGIVLLALSQYIGKGGVYSAWNADQEMKFINEISMPPEDCEIIFISENQEKINRDLFTIYHLNAISIAEKFNLETINGFNSYYPKGWEKINLIYDNNYKANIYAWVKEHDLKNVYEYDIENNTWNKFESLEAYELINKDTPSFNGVFSENGFEIQSGGYIYGPHITLFPGKYTIKIKGENLANVKIKCTYNFGKEELLSKLISSSDDAVNIELNPGTKLENFEVVITNEKEESIILESIVLGEEGEQ